MEELLKGITYTNGYEDELVMELLDNVSPFFVSTQDVNNYSTSPFSISGLISADFPESTTEELNNVVKLNNVVTYQHNFSGNTEAQSRMTVLEKGLNKIENRYTLKIKICESSMADDGYKWRKYGQKSIKNSPNPRSYYKCTNLRCSAKKQVERSRDDTDTLIVTYEGLHLHYTYPFNTPCPDQQFSPPTKKSKFTITKAQVQAHKQVQAQAHDGQDTEEIDESSKNSTEGSYVYTGPTIDSLGPQGMLEDMVPLIIRNPSNNCFTSSSSSCSSYSPSLPNSPFHSWSPNYCSTLFDLGFEL